MSMSNYTQLTPEFFQKILTSEDMKIIEDTNDNPKLIPALRSIVNYSKTSVLNSITTDVVQAFRNIGITCFGTTVRDCQSKIGEFLEYHPECRDVVAGKCFKKILYKAYTDYHRPPQQNQPVQNQTAIGFVFG